MKIVTRIASLTAAIVLSTSAHANLIQDGDFSVPNQSGGWNIYSPGTSGWTNGNNDGIEIGTSPIYGLPCANGGYQNLEVAAADLQNLSLLGDR
jgi:hypothetical protein